MRTGTLNKINLGGRYVDYRLVGSKAARKIRIRVGPSGVEVVHPIDRARKDIESFLRSNSLWLLGQLDRVKRLRSIRISRNHQGGTMLYQGRSIKVRVESNGHRGANKITLNGTRLVIDRGIKARTSAARMLENWLREQAREEIRNQVDAVGRKLKRFPRKVYVRGQRTKWGNCSSLNNLSFNWRLILAPDFVLRYLVTHEMVHLAVPEHSARFWLTVQGLCPDMQKSKRWLSANSDRLFLDLQEICNPNH